MRCENKGQTSHEIEFFQGFSPGTAWGGAIQRPKGVACGNPGGILMVYLQ
jgi:hypothetical protein